MKKYVSLLTIVFSLAGINTIMAQADNDNDNHDIVISIPEVALVDIEGSSGTSINLGPEAPTEAGLGLDFGSQTNSDLWLNYSSIISTANNPSRNITAKVSSGTLPGGMAITVTAGADQGNGDGTTGTSAGTVTLTSSDINIITGIGSSYTGDGTNNGHNLTYALTLASGGTAYSDLDADDASTIEVTYTITDN